MEGDVSINLDDYMLAGGKYWSEVWVWEQGAHAVDTAAIRAEDAPEPAKVAAYWKLSEEGGLWKAQRPPSCSPCLPWAGPRQRCIRKVSYRGGVVVHGYQRAPAHVPARASNAVKSHGRIGHKRDGPRIRKSASLKRPDLNQLNYTPT